MRGRPFQPGNKMGRGRPPGSKNKRSAEARELLNRYKLSLMGKSIKVVLEPEVDEMGRPKEPVKWDRTMLRQLNAAVLDSERGLVKLGPLPTRTAEEISRSSEKVIKKYASGRISSSEASQALDLLEKRRRVIEAEDHEKRLRALEQNLVSQPAQVSAPASEISNPNPEASYAGGSL